MNAKLRIVVMGLALVLSAVGCSENVTGPQVNGGGTEDSGGSGDSGGNSGSSVAVNFPLHAGSQWVYQAELRDGSSSYTGQFSASLVSYDASTRIGKLILTGDRYYNNRERIPHTVYLRDTPTGLERANSPAGPWKTVYSTTTGSWSDGGFIFAGTPGKTIHQSANQVAVPAGSFNSVYVKAHYDNRGQQYAMEIYDNDWAENIDPTIGLLKSYTYSYYHNRDPKWPLPTSSTFTVELTGYAIAMPDGSTVTGGSGAQVELRASIAPETSDYELIEDVEFIVHQDRVPLVLSFTKAMDRQSVEHAFEVDYWDGSTFRMCDGSFTWSDDTQAVWTPNSRYLANISHRIELHNTAHTSDGEALSQALWFGITYTP